MTDAVSVCVEEIVDCHTHVFPRFLTDERPDGWPGGVIDVEGRVCVPEGDSLRPLPRSMWDLRERFDPAARAGVALEVVSLLPSLFCYDADPAIADGYCHRVNEWLAGLAVDYRRDAVVLGVLPMQDVELALTHLQRVAELGLVGVAFGSRARGSSTADRRFLPVFTAAESLGLLIFVHSNDSSLGSCADRRIVRNAIAIPADMGAYTASLLWAGLPSIAPGLRILLSHGGGGFPATLARLASAWERDSRFQAALHYSPIDAAKYFYYDCMTFGSTQLGWLAEVVGTERIVFGSDEPSLSRAAAHAVLCPGLECSSTYRDVHSANARSLLGMVSRL